jgi:hypothetical protein
MPFNPEFKKHLHSLMVEIAETTSDERQQFKRERIWKAQQTHNAAALPIAYMDAELHSIETRVGKTIEKNIEALAIWGFDIDSAIEKEMIQQFLLLTAGPNQLHFPPMLKGPNVQAVQASFARERAKLANRLVREETNRLSELKIKSRRSNQSVGSTTNNIFSDPVGNAYINSTVQTNASFVISPQLLDEIEHVSEGHPELQVAATELKNASQGKLEKAQKWIALANSIAGLSDKIYRHYPQIEAFVKHLS